MSSIFIADLHLKISKHPETYRNFTGFLEHIRNKCDNLYILGDLFSHWYEHEGVDFYSHNPALKALKEFNSDKKKVYFLYGNRDFTAGRFFKEYSGVDYIGDDLTIEDKHKKIYLTHGDKFAGKDPRYYIWRKFIRSDIAVFVFKALPVGYAISLADLFTKVGKNRPSIKRRLADIMMKKSGLYLKRDYDAVIMGHAHYKLTGNFDIDKKNKSVYILPEFKFPGKSLFLKDGIFKYKYFG